MISIEKALFINLTSGLSLGAAWRGQATDPIAPNDVPATLILNGLHVAELRQLWEKQAAPACECIQALSAQADRLLNEGPWSVVDKADLPPGFDPHNYLSLAKYWRPNPDTPDGLPYINCDGEPNPECYSDRYDLIRFERFSEATLALALSAYLTGNPQHRDRALLLLDTWFTAPATRQNPEFQYSQQIPGDTKLRWSGVIEARRYIYIIEAIRLLEASAPLPDTLKSSLTFWFRTFLDWLRDSEIGVRASVAENNIGLWYDLQCMVYACFIGDEPLAQKILITQAVQRISTQCSSDGAMEHELKRAKPYEYTAFALTALAGIAAIGDRLGLPIWEIENSEGRILETACAWFQSLPAAQELKLGLLAPGPLNAEPTATTISDLTLQLGLLTRVAEARRHRVQELKHRIHELRHKSMEERREASAKISECTQTIADLKNQQAQEHEAACVKVAQLAKLQENTESLARALVEQKDQAKARITDLEQRVRNHKERIHVLETRATEREARLHLVQANLCQIKGRLSYRMAKPLRIVDRLFPSTATPPPPRGKEQPKAPLSLPEAETTPSATSLDERNTFALYRVIGNDLYPRHEKGQNRRNLEFILKNEPQLPGCEKHWVINRIVDADEQAAILDLLRKHKQEWILIPFDMDEYKDVNWDYSKLPHPDYLASREFNELPLHAQELFRMSTYRLKNNYVMNNNGARNTALAHGRTQARWVLPWDGNCFITEDAWKQIRTAVKLHANSTYFTVPMERVQDNRALLKKGYKPAPTEEPQIIFRYDSSAVFNEAFAYGRRPKVEMLWHLKVPGPWDSWTDHESDQPRRPAALDAGEVRAAGWVARLFSGNAKAEGTSGKAAHVRAKARNEAIITALEWIDARAKHYSPAAAHVKFAEPELDYSTDPIIPKISDRIEELQSVIDGQPILHRTPVAFAISLKSKCVSKNWAVVELNLARTLRSIINNTHQEFIVVVAGHERPEIAELDNPKVKWISVNVPIPQSPQQYPADKMRKRRAIGAYLRKTGFCGYFAPCDADDWINHRYIEFLHKTPVTDGIIFDSGVMVNCHTKEAWIRENRFYIGCGTSAALYLKPEDFLKTPSEELTGNHGFKCALGGHGQMEASLREIGRTPIYIKFPMVTWVLCNGENASLEMGKKSITIGAQNYKNVSMGFDAGITSFFKITEPSSALPYKAPEPRPIQLAA